jgi:hypothetical protein
MSKLPIKFQVIRTHSERSVQPELAVRLYLSADIDRIDLVSNRSISAFQRSEEGGSVGGTPGEWREWLDGEAGGGQGETPLQSRGEECRCSMFGRVWEIGLRSGKAGMFGIFWSIECRQRP